MRVILHSRPPVVIRAEENNKLHNGKPELMFLNQPTLLCFWWRSRGVGKGKFLWLRHDPFAVLFCAVFVCSYRLTMFTGVFISGHMQCGTAYPLRFLKWVWRSSAARSAVSHGADCRPQGSAVQLQGCLLLCHCYTTKCQGQTFLTFSTKNTPCLFSCCNPAQVIKKKQQFLNGNLASSWSRMCKMKESLTAATRSTVQFSAKVE